MRQSRLAIAARDASPFVQHVAAVVYAASTLVAILLCTHPTSSAPRRSTSVDEGKMYVVNEYVCLDVVRYEITQVFVTYSAPHAHWVLMVAWIATADA